jgi:hypothetical protein
MSPSFFSWMLPNAVEESTENLEREHDRIARLEEDLQNASLSRPSGVSRTQWTKWQVFEENRRVGNLIRREEDDYRREKQRRASGHAALGKQRAASARALRGAVADQVRTHRLRNRERGAQTKAEKQEWAAREEAQKREWSDHTNKAHEQRSATGKEQRRRMEESRKQMVKDKHAKVERMIAERKERAVAEYSQAQQALEVCRERVDRVREETGGDIAAAAARTFYQNRLHTADVVRKSLQNWRSEAKEDKIVFAMSARERRDEQLSRNGAMEGKEALRQQRITDAQKMRSSIAHIEARDKHIKLESLSRKKESHQAAYGSQYVDPPTAARVERSAYTTVANAHRLVEQGDTPATPVGSNKKVLSAKSKGRAAWASYFGNLTATSSRTFARDGQFGSARV